MESILLDAKKEYSKQLVAFLTPALYDELYHLWTKAVADDKKTPMRRFQDLLEEIAEWDESKKLHITDQCIEKSGCKYLEDLLTAVFVAHTKVLMSIKNKSNLSKDSYKLQVPTSNRFVYECLVQCARDFWKSPYLFYQNETENKIDKIQIQKNLRIAEGYVKDAIMETVRNLLPIKDVLGSILEFNEMGGVVVEIQSKKETISRESAGVDSTENTESIHTSTIPSTATTLTVPSTPTTLTTPSTPTTSATTSTTSSSIKLQPALKDTSVVAQTSARPNVSIEDNLREIQETRVESTTRPSFKEAELGRLQEESKVDDAPEEDIEGVDEGNDGGDDGEGEFDWNTIVVGPVDETIQSSLQEDVEVIGEPPSQNPVDDLLGAVEEL